MPDFRIYYDGGNTYDGDPFCAPAFGILVIVEKDEEHGRRLVTAKDYYCWDENNNRWWCFDYIGMIDYLAQPGRKRVLFGRTVKNSIWYSAMKRANYDPDFPPRTAWGALEEHCD
jgi:hypothetical protein